MADLKRARNDAKTQLYDEIDEAHAGMLGVDGSGLHMQPMAPQLDRDSDTIWFFARKSAEMVKAIRAGAQAHFCITGKDHDYHACIAGPISVDLDTDKRDAFWNTVIDAWFEDGKNDPDLTMLALRMKDAKIWASTDSKLKFGWEIAKANVSHDEPEVGVTREIGF